ENTVVSSLVSKDEVQAAELNEMVEKTFEGSLPAFIAAFTKHQRISEKEIDAVQAMIDRYRKGE
ncbi:MAG: BlaI/MecI/CopY family transcriptional regulator, partial [Clostridia bacterium]|nr:BlaI/MecI/CopY family transcriptional regulator [Clostridia bacterium]